MQPLTTTTNNEEPLPPVDTKTQCFPYCVVWSPLHPLTWFFPMIGHLGIADAEGNTYDFGGSYTINKNQLCFGHATRYWQLNPKKCMDLSWNKGINVSINDYSNQVYSFFNNNCHDFVANCLNNMCYDGVSKWNSLYLVINMLIHGKFCCFSDMLISLVPFCLFVLFIVLFCIFI
ncbi:hypothetical protein WA158_000723 [Blastocystis sp. Blastoise]